MVLTKNGSLQLRNIMQESIQKSFSSSATSNWHHYFKGIFQGCTVSIILFLVGITSSASSVIYSNKVSLPCVRAFMDDMNLMCTSVAGTQDLLFIKCVEALFRQVRHLDLTNLATQL